MDSEGITAEKMLKVFELMNRKKRPLKIYLSNAEADYLESHGWVIRDNDMYVVDDIRTLPVRMSLIAIKSIGMNEWDTDE